MDPAKDGVSPDRIVGIYTSPPRRYVIWTYRLSCQDIRSHASRPECQAQPDVRAVPIRKSDAVRSSPCRDGARREMRHISRLECCGTGTSSSEYSSHTLLNKEGRRRTLSTDLSSTWQCLIVVRSRCDMTSPRLLSWIQQVCRVSPDRIVDIYITTGEIGYMDVPPVIPRHS